RILRGAPAGGEQGQHGGGGGAGRVHDRRVLERTLRSTPPRQSVGRRPPHPIALPLTAPGANGTPRVRFAEEAGAIARPTVSFELAAPLPPRATVRNANGG